MRGSKVDDDLDRDINAKFADYLNRWVEHTFGKAQGSRRKAADFLGVADSTLNNWCAGRRRTSEGFRRQFAKRIGVDYETILGLSGEDDSIYAGICVHQSDDCIYHPSPDRMEILKMAKDVLESDTFFAESLKANIKSSHKAVENHRHIEKLRSNKKDKQNQ